MLKVRNKQMSKRETEKMVKEIWKDKMVEMRAGKHTDMAEFIFQHLQKRLGIVTAVIEVGLPSTLLDLVSQRLDPNSLHINEIPQKILGDNPCRQSAKMAHSRL